MAGLVTVKVFHSLPEAEVARSMLEHHGISVLLPDRNVAATAWYLTQAVGGIRLQVPEDELVSARLLLGAQDDVLAEGGVDRCPSCGSGDIFRPVSLIAGLAAFFLVGIPYLMRRRERYCRQCRHRWSQPPN